MPHITTEKTTEINWKLKELNIDVTEVLFELDALQGELINRYIRQDKNFLRAYFTNYTNLFMQFIKDKVRLNEPTTFSFMGQTRSGKSTSAITVAGLIMEARDKLMTVNKICPHQYSFMETIKSGKAEFGDVFVIDESKDAVFGVGSMAKKFKLVDIQNIIAVNNISTIWIRPDGWAFENSQYGLRAFGRGQSYKDGRLLPVRLNRFMLYNLQESSAGGSLPLGMVYLPHFADILKNGKQLWIEYSEKKQSWVDEEQKGEGDALTKNMISIAEKIFNYPKFKLLKGGNQKKTFVATALGSEATRGEITNIYELIKLLEQGFSLQEVKDFMKTTNQ